MAGSTKFTPEQEAVIRHGAGNAVVSAVAGSGKSTTMVERVAFLLEQGVPAWQILIIQYNTKAKRSMEAKLQRRMGRARAPKARTFHSVGLGMRNQLVRLGVLDDAELLQGYDETRYIREALQKAWSRTNGKDEYIPEELSKKWPEFVTKVKSGTRSAAEVLSQDYRVKGDVPFVEAFELLQQRCEADGKMFFDDQLYHPFLALRKQPELWREFAGKYTHLIVDEFQDANLIQFWLMQGICGMLPYQVPAGDGSNEMVEARPRLTQCMVVGDGDQSVYRFRGSDPGIIHSRFERSFSPCTRYPMNRTFRYGHETAMLANSLICRNPERDDKITVAGPGCPDTRVHMRTFGQGSLSGISSILAVAHKEGRLHRTAMLVRYFSMAVPHEIELVDAGIPFFVHGRAPLLQVDEIAALTGALFTATNYWTVPDQDRRHFFRAMLKVPSMYLVEKELNDLADQLSAAYIQGNKLAPVLQSYAQRFAATQSKKAERIAKRATTFGILESGTLAKAKPEKILRTYMDTTGLAYQMASETTRKDLEEMHRNVSAFYTAFEKYESINDVLEKLGACAGEAARTPPEGDHLVIHSIHGAKGEEFPTVILPGWTRDVFPREGEDLAEERRLAYVAVTRAIHNLIFLVPEDEEFSAFCSNIADRPKLKRSQVSQFLIDAEPGLAAQVAGAIRSGASTKILARDSTVATRYLQEIGNDAITVSPARPVVPLEQEVASSDYILLNLVPGQSLFRRKDGAFEQFEVEKTWGQGLYSVISVATRTLSVIDVYEDGWEWQTA